MRSSHGQRSSSGNPHETWLPQAQFLKECAKRECKPTWREMRESKLWPALQHMLETPHHERDYLSGLEQAPPSQDACRQWMLYCMEASCGLGFCGRNLYRQSATMCRSTAKEGAFMYLLWMMSAKQPCGAIVPKAFVRPDWDADQSADMVIPDTSCTISITVQVQRSTVVSICSAGCLI